jgi:hypothetical protein
LGKKANLSQLAEWRRSSWGASGLVTHNVQHHFWILRRLSVLITLNEFDKRFDERIGLMSSVETGSGK